MPVRRALFVALIIVAAAAVDAGAKNWYVYANGSGVTPTIQSAVDSSAVSGDAVLIQKGTYHESAIVVDGKNVAISQFEGQVYLISPSAGSGTCLTFRNATAFMIDGILFRGYETGIAVESASGIVQSVTMKQCSRGVTVSGSGSSPTVWYSLVDSCETGIEVQDGSVNLQNETIVNCPTGTLFLGGSAIMSRTIMYNCETGVQCSGGSVSLSCNDFYLNVADYAGCSPGVNDFYTDPKFCFWKSSAGPYWLHDTSPCFTKDNPCGVYIGAFTSPIPGCTGTAVQQATWGSIKSIYR
jgi:hypothetical protein